MARVEVKGLRELGERMRLLSSDMSLKIARSATAAAAGVVKKAARHNIESSPAIVTRALLNNVIIKRVPRGQTNLTSEHIVTVRGRGKSTSKKGRTSGAPHAHFIEFGTVNQPPEPFLRPALERNVDRATAAMVKRIEAGLKKAGR